MPLEEFRIGELYEHKEIYEALKMPSSRGIRYTTSADAVTSMLLIFYKEEERVPDEVPYNDRIEGEILHYTGEGLVGHQRWNERNKRILEQKEYSFPIHIFMCIRHRRKKDPTLGLRTWRYLGLFEFVRTYEEVQPDKHGMPRRVMMFSLSNQPTPPAICITEAEQLATEALANHRRVPLSDKADHEVIVHTSVQSVPTTEPARTIARARILLANSQFETFERAVRLCAALAGFSRAETSSNREQGSVSLSLFSENATWPRPGPEIKAIAFRWGHPIDRREVAQFKRSLRPNEKGCILTTGFYTKAALDEAESQPGREVALLNGFEWCAYMQEKRALEILFDPNELLGRDLIRNVCLARQQGMSFNNIEKKFGLRRANGMTAYRIVKKHGRRFAKEHSR